METLKQEMSIQSFLEKAPNPPPTEAVEKAVTLLGEIGALTDEEKITVLGRRLASLPMDPRTGKMILYGILFNCLDPILTIACAISHRHPLGPPLTRRGDLVLRSPWVMSIEDDDKAKAIRKEMSEPVGGASDHLATVQAFKAWQQSRSKAQFCYQNFLSHDAMYIIDGLRKKILTELRFRGMPVNNQGLKQNASDIGLVRSLLVCIGPECSQFSDDVLF